MAHDWLATWGSKGDALLVTLNAKAPPEPPYPPNRGWGSVLDPTLGGQAAFEALTALKSMLEDALGVDHTPNGIFVGGSIGPGPIQNQAVAVMTALPSDFPNHLGNGSPGWMTRQERITAERSKATTLLQRVRDAVDPPGSIGDVVFDDEGGAEGNGGCSCGTRCSCCCCCCRCRCMPKWGLMPWPYFHLRRYLTKRSRLPKGLDWRKPPRPPR